jgi:hypothetical protein
MPTKIPPTGLDDTKDFSSLVPAAFEKANAAFVQAANTTQYITFSQPGSITAPFTGVARLYPPKNITISNVYASLGTSSSTPFVFVIEKNGANVGAFTINTSAFKMNVTPANIVVTTDDYLTIDISSGTGATDLRVDLQYT